jgi:hypothetical protein
MWYNINTKEREREQTMAKLKRFWIYWDGGNNISCFRLHSRSQVESIAKQYPNVTKVEEKK